MFKKILNKHNIISDVVLSGVILLSMLCIITAEFYSGPRQALLAMSGKSYAVWLAFPLALFFAFFMVRHFAKSHEKKELFETIFASAGGFFFILLTSIGFGHKGVSAEFGPIKGLRVSGFAIASFVILALVVATVVALRIYRFITMKKANEFSTEVQETQDKNTKKITIITLISYMVFCLCSVMAIATITRAVQISNNIGLEATTSLKSLYLVWFLLAFAWLALQYVFQTKISVKLKAIIDVALGGFLIVMFFVSPLTQEHTPDTLYVYTFLVLVAFIVSTVYSVKVLNKLAKEKEAKEQEDEIKANGVNGISYFDGRLIQLIGWSLLCSLVNVVTLFIAYPATLCWKEKWLAKHTVINSKRLSFDGKGIQLFGNWIKWMLLCVVTIGIYSFWLPIKIEQWKTKHTHFEGEQSDENASKFDGRLIQLIGWNWACSLVNIFTIGIAYPATLCWKQRWYTKHRVIDGNRFAFDGKGIQLFGKWMLWLLLSVVTCGIFALWLPIKIEKWRVKHTKTITVNESV